MLMTQTLVARLPGPVPKKKPLLTGEPKHLTGFMMPGTLLNSKECFAPASLLTYSIKGVARKKLYILRIRNHPPGIDLI